MSKFKEMIEAKAKAVAKPVEKEVAEKSVNVDVENVSTKAPKDIKVAKSFDMVKNNADVARVLDMAFILKQMKKSVGESLTEKDYAMFNDAIQEKAGTTVADIAAVIPSGFTGTFLRDMYAMTSVSELFPMKQIGNFGLTDTVGVFGMDAYVVSELNTPADTNDSMIEFEYRGGKVMAKTYASYEAIQDASIDLLADKRAGLMRAMAAGLEKAILNGQSGDDGIAGADVRTLFRGLRKLGLEKQTVDFGGATLTEATFKAKILEAQDLGGLYTSWDEISAGNVVIVLPNKVYNSILGFDGFSDASKSGMGSTLASGTRVSSVFGIPVVTNRFYPAAVNATGVIDATAGNNTLQSAVMVNTSTLSAYAITNSALMEMDKDIETQKYVMTASNRVGFASIYDQTPTAPTAIDATRKNVISLININA